MPYTLSRSLLTVIIPGIIAAAPWMLLLTSSEVHLHFPQHPVLISGVALAIVTILGSTFEGLGSFFEAHWDKKLEKRFDVEKNWYIYLASQPNPQPIGYEYLTKLVTTLYFELAMMFAAPISIAGIGTLAWRMYPQHENQIILVSILLALFSVAYYEYQAKSTHRVICKTRFELNGRLRH